MADYIGTKGQDVLDGGGDNDFVSGLAGDDFLYGEGGDDTVVGGAGGDIVLDRFDVQDFSPNGNDLLIGGAGNDHLMSSEGQDTLLGGKGDDEIDVYRHIDGNDDAVIARGGSGNDFFWFSSYNAGEHIRLYGGSGDDRFHLWGSKGLLHVDLGTGHDMVWAASRYADGDGPVMISQFQAGDGGDVLVLNGNLTKGFPRYVDGLIHWHHDNPFADGHLRLVQDGRNVELQVDVDGHHNGENFSVSIIFRDANVSDFAADNFGGYDPLVT